MKTPKECLAAEMIRGYNGTISITTPEAEEVIYRAMRKYAKQLLEDYTNRIVENTETSWVSDGYSTGMWQDMIDKKSITSQLPQFLKETGI